MCVSVWPEKDVGYVNISMFNHVCVCMSFIMCTGELNLVFVFVFIF